MDIPNWVIYLLILVFAAIFIFVIIIMGWLPESLGSINEILSINPID